MPTEPMTEQQMREYLESVWVGPISTITTYGITEYSICVDEGRIKLSAAKSESEALRTAVEFTERRRRDVERMEKRINVLMIADADLRDKPYGNPKLFFELLRETKVILESQLTELRRGLKEGAFRGN